MKLLPLVYMQYHGEVEIAYWEYVLALVFLLALYIWSARRKNLMIKRAPEYRFYLWGFTAKIVGGVVFSLIFFYYYKGGDTMSYFYSAVSMSKLAVKDPLGYLHVLFGEATVDKRRYFDLATGWPYGYVFYDPRTFFVIRMISPLVIFTFNSYLVTTVVLAALSYSGIWACYRTFTSYFPSLSGRFAIAFLFMPSVIFWGSAILKDTFTLSAVCWWIHSVDEFYFKKRDMVANVVIIVLSATVIIVMKPYIFLVLFPVTLLWMFHSRLSAIRSPILKYMLLPMAVVAQVAISINILQWLDQSLGRFSLDNALRTIEISQADLKRADSYGVGYFDIGELDGTWTGLMSKFPVATNAGLFRPYVWESSSPTMFLSALENLWLMMIVGLMLLRTRLLFPLRCMFGNPLVLLSLAFALLFAFMVGVTTPNFGAMVRFKIPMVPLLVSGVFIVGYLWRQKRYHARHNKPFDLRQYQRGELRAPAQAPPPKHRAGAGGGRP